MGAEGVDGRYNLSWKGLLLQKDRGRSILSDWLLIENMPFCQPSLGLEGHEIRYPINQIVPETRLSQKPDCPRNQIVPETRCSPSRASSRTTAAIYLRQVRGYNIAVNPAHQRFE
jgi:hypothetical protein